MIAHFQRMIAHWTRACFGEKIARNRDERNQRFLEESLELVQSLGASKQECHDLVDYVFGRDIGETPQEIGGVLVCLASLCDVADLDMEACGWIELERVDSDEMMEKIRRKHSLKPKFGKLSLVETEVLT